MHHSPWSSHRCATCWVSQRRPSVSVWQGHWALTPQHLKNSVRMTSIIKTGIKQSDTVYFRLQRKTEGSVFWQFETRTLRRYRMAPLPRQGRYLESNNMYESQLCWEHSGWGQDVRVQKPQLLTVWVTLGMWLNLSVSQSPSLVNRVCNSTCLYLNPVGLSWNLNEFVFVKHAKQHLVNVVK